PVAVEESQYCARRIQNRRRNHRFDSCEAGRSVSNRRLLPKGPLFVTCAGENKVAWLLGGCVTGPAGGGRDLPCISLAQQHATIIHGHQVHEGSSSAAEEVVRIGGPLQNFEDRAE